MRGEPVDPERMASRTAVPVAEVTAAGWPADRANTVVRSVRDAFVLSRAPVVRWMGGQP